MLTKNKIEKVLKEINQKLVTNISNYAGVYLIGSNSEAELKPSSDVDIVITVNENKIDYKLKRQIVELIYDIQVQNDIVLDVKIYTTNDILNPATPFRANVQKDGILYVS